MLTHAAAVLTTSDWTRRRLLDRYALDPARLHVAEPGVDGADLAPGSAAGGPPALRRRRGPGQGARPAGDGARAGGGPALAVHVCRRGRPRLRPFSRRVVHQTEQQGIADRLRFVGALEESDLNGLYAVSDVLLLASRYETYGLVVTEALARGLPVLACVRGRGPRGTGSGARRHEARTAGARRRRRGACRCRTGLVGRRSAPEAVAPCRLRATTHAGTLVRDGPPGRRRPRGDRCPDVNPRGRSVRVTRWTPDQGRQEPPVHRFYRRAPAAAGGSPQRWGWLRGLVAARHPRCSGVAGRHRAVRRRPRAGRRRITGGGERGGRGDDPLPARGGGRSWLAASGSPCHCPPPWPPTTGPSSSTSRHRAGSSGTWIGHVRHGRDVGDTSRGLRSVVWERVAGQVVLVAVAGSALVLLPSPVRHGGPRGRTRGRGGNPGSRRTAGRPALGAASRRPARRRAPAWVRGGEGRMGRPPGSGAPRPTRSRVLLASVVAMSGHVLTFLVATRTAGSGAAPLQVLPLALVVLLAMGLPNVAGWGPREGVAAWAFSAGGLGCAAGRRHRRRLRRAWSSSERYRGRLPCSSRGVRRARSVGQWLNGPTRC